MWLWFYVDFSKPLVFHVEGKYYAGLSHEPWAGAYRARSQPVAREIQELTYLPPLPFQRSQLWKISALKHLSTEPGILLMNGRNEQGGGNSCSTITHWKRYSSRGFVSHLRWGGGGWGAPDVWRAGGSFSLSTLEIKGLDSKPEINHHSLCKKRN